MYGFWDNGFREMMNFTGNWSMWFLIYNGVKFVIIVVVIILLARMLMNNSKSNKSFTSNRAVEILKERYARGEIDEEEYKAKMKVLKDRGH